MLIGKFTSKHTIPTLINETGSKIYSDTEKAALANKYFCSVFTKDNGSHPNFEMRVPDSIKIETIEFTEYDVYQKLLKLPNKTSAGPDKIPQIFLKRTAILIAGVLSIIMNISMSQHTLPNDWLNMICNSNF